MTVPSSRTAWNRRSSSTRVFAEARDENMTKKWKGKAREAPVYPEGNGGTEGIVLPLDQVGGGVFDVAYTLSLKVGPNGENFPVQVDTGSSDLWIASSSCSTSSCGQTSGKLYNPKGSTDTGFDFSIPYLQGSASGPIVWDKVEVGGYVIETQALSAASDVQNEPLTPQFTGILGLALPLNSVISKTIPPVTGNSPDGAVWASNLFSITPVSSAPSARFLSLALSRPGSDRIPSILGIGRHPSSLVPDPSKVSYSTLVSDSTGSLFWKTGVRDISVYVDGERKAIDLGRSNTGAVFPSAVLDSGVPLILMTRDAANAIYGAIGIGPANDGQYYVPCTTPLNVSVTLDNRPEMFLHPLDLTGEPPQDNRATNCIGLIQAEDRLASASSGIGDMILGVPFLRNTYTVMGYSIPDSNGVFPTDDKPGSIRPRLGLLSLTDPQVAFEEFHTVRVLNQPLPSTGNEGSVSSRNPGSSSTGRKGLSVGIIVLISLLAFFALCFSLFGLRFFLLRRRMRKVSGFGENKSAYELAKKDDCLPSEEELRRMRYDEYMRKERPLSLSMAAGGEYGTGITPVEPAFEMVGEFGMLSKRKVDVDPWDPRTSLFEGDDTLVGSMRRGAKDGPGSDSESLPRKYHQRTLTEDGDVREGHKKQLSITLPLLPGEEDYSNAQKLTGDAEEFGVRTSMAGVGTANRTRGISMLRDSVSTGGSISLAPNVTFESSFDDALRRHNLEGTPRSSTFVPEEGSVGDRGSLADRPRGSLL